MAHLRSVKISGSNLEHQTPPDRAPNNSPRERLDRVMQETVSDRVVALDRLAAIDELRTWLDEQEREAVIGARMARVTWAEMGQAVGTSRQGAYNRWGSAIKGYEAAGLLDAGAAGDDLAEVPPGEWPASKGLDPTLTTRKAMETGKPDVPGTPEIIETTAQADVVIPHPPVDPAGGGLTDARNWCRWCGHRVIEERGGDGWVHHVSDGAARGEGIIDVPDCPGNEPWPASAEWPR